MSKASEEKNSIGLLCIMMCGHTERWKTTLRSVIEAEGNSYKRYRLEFKKRGKNETKQGEEQMQMLGAESYLRSRSPFD
eukprot:scaffold2992_cov83-Skeletonema_dohrnii-CCMP3373.AAC.6